MSIEAMQQALNALKRLNDIDGMYSWVDTEQALRQAIAQAEKQKALDKKADNARELGLGYEPEPVAYIDHVSGKPKFINGYVVQTDYDIPLYTESPQAEKQTHTDHPMRHWDRTCPACVEQAEKQEPVAWMTNSEQDVTAEFLFSHVQTPMHNIPLYEAPLRKEWVGLTEDDIWDAYEKGMYEEMWFARAVEAMIKERNT
jgi:hypothetical protein